MKHVIVTVLLLMLAVCAFAQEQYAWEWAKRATHTGQECMVNSITHDSEGNIYTTGRLYGSNQFGNISVTGNYFYLFVAKQSPSGDFIWVRTAFSTYVYSVIGYGITVDSSGDVYVTGEFTGDTTFGNQTLTTSSWRSFVAKLSSNGDWVWAKKGGGGYSSGSAIAVDIEGSIYFTGYSSGGNFSFDNISTTYFGWNDVFIVKLLPDGTCVGVTSAGGAEYDRAYSICIDNSNNVIITGTTNSPQALFGTQVIANSTAYYNIFVAKYNSNLSISWVSNTQTLTASSSLNNQSYSVATDSANNVYICGWYQGVMSVGDANISSNAQSKDAFICKLNSSGYWIWAQSAGGVSDDYAYTIDVNAIDGVYLAGSYINQAVFGDITATNSGSANIYVAKYNSQGVCLCVKSAGSTTSSGNSQAYSLDVIDNQNILVAGFVNGDHIQFGGISSVQLPGGNYADVFIAKLSEFVVDFTSNTTTVDIGVPVLFTDNSNGHPTSWAWDFDNDGITDSNQQNPSKVYSSIGTYSVKLCATEDALTSITTTKVNYINVIHSNHAPTILSSISPITFNEDTTYNLLNLSNHFADSDLVYGDHLTYSYTPCANLSINISNGIVTFTPTANYYGTQVVTFTATDDLLASVSISVTITVAPVNDPPVINLPVSVNFNEDSSLTLDLNSYVTDIDNTVLVVSAQNSAHVFATITGMNAVITATLNWNGTEIVHFTVSDGQAAITGQTTVTVNPVNDPPVIDLPTSFTYAEDGNLLVNMTPYVLDLDNSNITLTASGNQNVTVLINGLDVTLGALPNWYGSESITFTVNDNVGRAIASDITNVIVTPVNDPPVINLPASFTFAEDTNLVLNMATYVSDIDNANLTVTAQNSEHVSVVMNGLTATLTATVNWNGTEAIHFTVSDGLLIATGQTNIIVTPVNDAPTINLPTSFTFDEDSTLNINMSDYASDVDNTNLTITASGNQNVIVSISGMNVTLSALVNWNSFETITFTVNDNVSRSKDPFRIMEDSNTRLTSSATTNIIVTPVNDAPIINLPSSFTFAEDGNLEIGLASYVSDIDNTNLTITAQNSEHISVVINGLTATLTAAANWNGTEAIQFTVSDGILNATGQTNVIVTPVNDAPTINLPTSFTFSEDNTLNINLLNYVSDIDNTNLTLTATGNQNITINVSGMNVILGALPNWNGSEILVFTVNDNVTKAIASDTVLVTVIPVNDPPIIVSFFPIQTTLTVQQNDTMSFGINATDVDSQIYYSWFINNEIQSITTNEFTHLFDQSATYQVKGIATDSVSTVEKIWTVTVPVGNDDPVVTPMTTRLYQNYPNPFNPETTIRYSLKTTGDVNLSIFNIRGQLIKVLKNCNLKAGDYTQTWNGLNDHNMPVSSGIYYIRMTTSSDVYIVKTILMK